MKQPGLIHSLVACRRRAVRVAAWREGGDYVDLVKSQFVAIESGSGAVVADREAHEELLAYLAAHRDVYWTDTFMSIMKYVKAQQAARRAQP